MKVIAWVFCLVLLQAGAANAFPTADYLPLDPGDSWTGTEDGTTTTNMVQGTPTMFNGISAMAVQKSNGDITYMTNDANGIMEIGNSSSVYIPNYGTTTVTIKLNQPFVFLSSDAALGAAVTSSGTVTLTYAGIGTYTLNFTGQSTPAGFESITVPAGTFTALKLLETLTISGTINGNAFSSSGTQTDWLVAKIGPVKETWTDTTNGVSTNHSFTLSSYNIHLPVTTPNPFSFTPQTNAVPGAMTVSTPITVSGINAPSPISISGGEYSINYGAYTSNPGTVNNGDSVTVRLHASMAFGSASNATLTIGGVSGSFDVSAISGMPAGNLLYYSSEPGDSVGQGQTQLMSPTVIISSVQSYVTFYTAVPAMSSNWNLTLMPPATLPLSIGSYENAQRAAGFPPGTPGLDFFGNGRGCNTDAGRFDILEASYDAMGNVLKFAVNFEQHCEGMAPALFGQLRYNSSIPVDLTLNSGYGEFPPGWNLAGNSRNSPITVSSTFNDPAKVITVWKWIPAKNNWAFYTPAQSDGGAAYAASQGYDSLTTIGPGEGYWLNAKSAFTATLPSGTPVTAASFQAMGSGWNLVSESGFITPSAFNGLLGGPPIVSLWAWDNASSRWFFYAPSLDTAGTLSSYIQAKGYLDFSAFGKTLRPGMGFWVNR